MAVIAASSSAGPQSPPSCQVPKATGETWSPVRPGVVYFVALPPVVVVVAEAGADADAGAGVRSRGRRTAGLRPGWIPVAVPRDERGERSGDRARQHGGSSALRGHRDRVVAYCRGDCWQPG